MIHIEALNKRFGERVLFADTGWHIKKRDRIGLSGPNGSGKSTLLRMLAGLDEPDSGEIRMATDTTVGYLPQDGLEYRGRTLYDEVSLAFEELLSLQDEQRKIEERLSRDEDDQAEHERLLTRYAEATERYKDLGGYEMDARIDEVLRGLGFQDSEWRRPCEEFSGGWQMRIALAKLLLARPNLLLMDEPTNHLDLPARNWLEEFLADYPGSVVLVAHDRYFLDATIHRITEVGLKTLTDYHGNHSHYLVEHAARMERLLESHRRQQEEIEKAEAFISRFRYKASKARQVQSRIKLLDKVERIEIPPQRKKIRFNFPEAPRPGRITLKLESVRRAYGDLVVLKDVDLLVERGDRIALVGPNGAGKSTLMRVLAGVDSADGGTCELGHNVVMEYFAQDQAKILDSRANVHEEMASVSPMGMVQRIRTILGGFLFSGDDIYKKVGVLSGGERNRLALAKMLLVPSSLLLLDEPTNHLDIDSKEVLLDAVLGYHGTIIFVSHDRYFVDRLATKVIEVGDGGIVSYPGGYEEFLEWKERRAAGEKPPDATSKRPAERKASEGGEAASGDSGRRKSRREERKAKREARGAAPPPPNPMAPRLRKKAPAASGKEGRQARTQVRDLEREISTKEGRVRELERAMAQPGFYDDRSEADPLVAEYQALAAEVGELMGAWEALQETVES